MGTESFGQGFHRDRKLKLCWKSDRKAQTWIGVVTKNFMLKSENKRRTDKVLVGKMIGGTPLHHDEPGRQNGVDLKSDK